MRWGTVVAVVIEVGVGTLAGSRNPSPEAIYPIVDWGLQKDCMVELQ